MAEQRGTESIGQNVRGLLTQAERLARTEVELAVAKGKDSLSNQARYLVMLVGAALLGLGGMAYLLYAVYSGLAARMDGWATALSTAGVSFACAFVFLKLGATREAPSDAPISSRPRAVSTR